MSSAFKFDIKKPKDVYAADDYYDKDETDPLVFLDVVCVTMISYVRNYCKRWELLSAWFWYHRVFVEAHEIPAFGGSSVAHQKSAWI